MPDRTLEEKRDYAVQQRALAQKAIDSAEQMRASARDMGGGLLSFGGSGSQRAREKVRLSTDRALKASYDAHVRFERWDSKVRGYESRIEERDRRRLGRDDLIGATHVRLDSGWWRVARLNATTVSVETGYSWTDRHPFDKVLEARTVARA